MGNKNLINYKFCIIIPTLNRTIDLIQTLKSICISSIKPNRIVIIDDGEIEKTKEGIKEYIISNPEIKFIIIRAKSTGLTMARNIGIKNKGDAEIIFFLDDDVTLEKDYIEKILETFERYRDIDGCQGFISNTINMNQGIRLLIGLMGFFLPIQRSFFTPSVSKTIVIKYPLFIPNKKIRKCQWLSGCNMAYRVEIFKNFKFDENLILYSFNEDFDFSYRLYKKGFKLAINFDAQLIHRSSTMHRRSKESLILMEMGYKFYEIYKYVPNRKLAYFVCRYQALNLFLLYCIDSFIRLRPDLFKNSLKSYYYIKLIEKDIANGNLFHLNTMIKKISN
jgi:GT2 family glycosyltransferase